MRHSLPAHKVDWLHAPCHGNLDAAHTHTHTQSTCEPMLLEHIERLLYVAALSIQWDMVMGLLAVWTLRVHTII